MVECGLRRGETRRQSQILNRESVTSAHPHVARRPIRYVLSSERHRLPASTQMYSHAAPPARASRAASDVDRRAERRAERQQQQHRQHAAADDGAAPEERRVGAPSGSCAWRARDGASGSATSTCSNIRMTRCATTAADQRPRRGTASPRPRGRRRISDAISSDAATGRRRLRDQVDRPPTAPATDRGPAPARTGSRCTTSPGSRHDDDRHHHPVERRRRRRTSRPPATPGSARRERSGSRRPTPSTIGSSTG